MNAPVKPELPVVDLAPVAQAQTAAVPEVQPAAAAAAVEKPFAAADQPTAFETFVAERDAKQAEHVANPKPAEEPVKPAAEAKPGDVAAKDPAAKAPETPVQDPAKEPPKDPAKPDAVAAQAAAADAKPTESAAPFVYEYKLPETLKMDDALKSEVHTAFDAFRADPAKGVQGLLDLHAKQMKTYSETLQAQMLDQQQRIFADTRKQWRTEMMADPEIGGAGHRTAMEAAARVRDRIVSNHAPGTKEYDADVQALNDFMRVTGAGDHPVFARIMHNAARFIDEPQFSSLPSEIKPPPGNGRAPGKSRIYSDESIQKMNGR